MTGQEVEKAVLDSLYAELTRQRQIQKALQDDDKETYAKLIGEFVDEYLAEKGGAE